MAPLFLFIYNYFIRHKFIFLTLIVILFLSSGYFSYQIKLEEDISKVIPKDKETEKFNFIFQNSKFVDKIVINIYQKDSTSELAPEKLIEFASILIDSIKNKFDSTLIKEVLFEISDEQVMNVYQTFYDNIPMFLSDKDYLLIDSLIQENTIKEVLNKNYKTLISPASLVLKKFIMRDPLGLAFMGLNKLKSLKVDENFIIYNGHIFTKDKKNLFLFISPANPANETFKNTALINGIDSSIKNTSSKFEYKISCEYFGGVAIAVSNAGQIKQDINVTMIIAFVVIILTLILFYKRITIPFIMFIPVLFGSMFSLAVLFLLRGKISAIALGVGSVLLGITIDYSIYLFTHFKHIHDVRSVIKDVSNSIIMGCTTTAAAFVCLLFTKSEGLRDLGWFGALYALSSAVSALIILPHLLKISKKDKERNSKKNYLDFINRIVSTDAKYNRYILVFILLITFILVFFIGKVGFETDMNKLNFVTPQLITAEQNLYKINNFTLKTVYLVSTGKNLNEALNNNENNIDKIEQLKSENIIKNYSSINSLMLSVPMQKSKINKWNQFWTKEKKLNLKQNIINISHAIKFKETAFNDFFNLMDKNFQVMKEDEVSTLRKIFFNDWITETKEITSIVTMIKVSEKDKSKVYSALENLSNITIMDKQFIMSKFINAVISEFRLLLILSSIFVFLILLISFGRIEIAVITFLPMAISWVWILGLMGLFGVTFNIFNIIVTIFVFGVGIDYSIFIIQGLLQEYSTNRKNLPSYNVAILLSSFSTIVGLGVLIFAKHPALKSIAAISVIGISSVVFLSAIIEPFLFRWLIYKGKKKRSAPLTLLMIIYAYIFYSFFTLGCILTLFLRLTIFRFFPFDINKRKLLYHKLLYIVSKATIFVMFLVKKKFTNFDKNYFNKPKLIICNHQSLIDIPLTIMITPKLIILTNDWVWDGFLSKSIVRLADYYPVSWGIDELTAKLEEKVKEGYSVLVFPEGTRSETTELNRFHKGAFYIAEKLKLDILPVIIHGTSHYVRKGELFGAKSTITLKFLDIIKYDDLTFGENYGERTKAIKKYFSKEFNIVTESYKETSYFKSRLIKNYIYKGPILEWYLRIKLRLEKNYIDFNNFTPQNGLIYDLGCGYGFLTYMLAFTSKESEIIGIDYDAKKIEIADNCISKPNNISFVPDDICQYNYHDCNGFILGDVLHYLPIEKQEELLLKCASKLNAGGIILIRDADESLKDRHFGTKVTELFSTKLGFNKTNYQKLFFSSEEQIRMIALKARLEFELVDKTKMTSNVFYILRKTKQGIDE